MSSDGWEQAPRTAKIAFTSVRDGNDEIYVMDVDGKNPRNLTNHAGIDHSPAWSANRFLFFSTRGQWTLRDECRWEQSALLGPRRQLLPS